MNQNLSARLKKQAEKGAFSVEVQGVRNLNFDFPKLSVRWFFGNGEKQMSFFLLV